MPVICFRVGWRWVCKRPPSDVSDIVAEYLAEAKGDRDTAQCGSVPVTRCLLSYRAPVCVKTETAGYEGAKQMGGVKCVTAFRAV